MKPGSRGDPLAGRGNPTGKGRGVMLKWSDLEWHEKLEEVLAFLALWLIFSLFFTVFFFLFYALFGYFLVPVWFIPIGGLIFFGLFIFDNR